MHRENPKYLNYFLKIIFGHRGNYKRLMIALEFKIKQKLYAENRNPPKKVPPPTPICR